ncbi:NAD(P)/FAD-dependent oxidoreductase [Anaerococcus sp. NML200537]|uniref:NAD(P)/FAD-dependent oxidoreductase n=1 Tax=Anaerococcus sp. NML200537 TaxID=2954485 RepID=UPI002238DBC2|nr:NAD(P)/FAD-dependent oxidoreductase [Anaerococcus sp. NML200537]MCW6701615.1 NAD(P)/FAD-dependent oxidoreductase [Anaerococcus sp. NML200537]
MKKIGIIGAGPAGLMTAILAKNENNEIYILERNSKIARKLKMTGGGRCNITNMSYDGDFLDKVVRNKKFVYSSYAKFNNYDLIDFLESEGIATIAEEDGRVFPKSQQSQSLIDFFYKKINDLGINLLTNTKVVDIKKNKKFIVKTDDHKFEFDSLVIATGGKSYPKTGSDGLGYDLCKKLGHHISKISPVLVPIFIKDKLNIKALSLKDVGLSLESDENSVYQVGDILINSDFITGPVVLRASSLIDNDKVNHIYIDFFTKYTYNELDDLLLDLINQNPKKSILNILKSIINDSLVGVIGQRLKIDKDLRASELSRDLRMLIIENLKKFELNFLKFGGYESAVVTRGGVDLSEINPSNMMSKKIDNLFFVGEILDIDSLTGGYNLQIYFSTAYACSQYIREKI